MDYSGIIRKSFDTTKKYKWLWVYGAVLGAFASSGGGMNFNNITNQLTNFSDPTSPSSTVKNDFQNIANFVGNLIKDVTPLEWTSLILSVIAIGILTMALKWIVASWAKGGIIKALDMALKGDKVTLENTAKFGFINVKNLILLSIISAIVPLLVTLGLFLAWFIAAGVLRFVGFDSVSLIFAILGGIIGIGVFIYFAIVFTITKIYAERKVVLDTQKPWAAWKSGLALARKNFRTSIVMGGINSVITFFVSIVSALVSGIALAIPGFLIIKNISPVGIVILVILVLVFIIIQELVSALMLVFKNANWNQIFTQITK